MLIDLKLKSGRLGGFVVEGLVPYGVGTSELRMRMLRKASFMGLPVVRVGRGYPRASPIPTPTPSPASTSLRPRPACC